MVNHTWRQPARLHGVCTYPRAASFRSLTCGAARDTGNARSIPAVAKPGSKASRSGDVGGISTYATVSFRTCERSAPALRCPISYPTPLQRRATEFRRARPVGDTFGDPVSMRRGREDDAWVPRESRRAGCPCGRVADGRASRGARGPSRVLARVAGQLAEQERALALTRSAAAEIEAPPGLRARIEAKGDGRAGNRTAWLLIGVVGAAAAVVAVAIGVARVAARSHRAEQLHSALGADGPRARREGRRDADQDDVWVADRTRRDWAAALSKDGGSTRRGSATPPGRSSRSGRSTRDREVTLWAGVSPEDFTLLTVTRERANDDQSSSGQKVLTGAVDTSG